MGIICSKDDTSSWHKPVIKGQSEGGGGGGGDNENYDDLFRSGGRRRAPHVVYEKRTTRQYLPPGMEDMNEREGMHPRAV